MHVDPYGQLGGLHREPKHFLQGSWHEAATSVVCAWVVLDQSILISISLIVQIYLLQISITTIPSSLWSRYPFSLCRKLVPPLPGEKYIQLFLHFQEKRRGYTETTIIRKRYCHTFENILARSTVYTCSASFVTFTSPFFRRLYWKKLDNNACFPVIPISTRVRK